MDWQNPIAVDEYNDRALKILKRAIGAGSTAGQPPVQEFVLILVRCNYQMVREQILSRLQSAFSIPLQTIVIPESARTLYTLIQSELSTPPPPGLMVLGLEAVHDIDAILTSTNQVREEFRKHLTFPLILWVHDLILQKLTRLAPDFKSWAATPIKFEVSTPDLFQFLDETINFVFAAILQTGAGMFLDNASLEVAVGTRWRSELELAQRDLKYREQPLQPELHASLQFLLGRDAEIRGDRNQARQYYENSLAYWQQHPEAERQGCVLFHLGLWWRREALLNRQNFLPACEQARDYFRQSLAVFTNGQRPDLVAKFINGLGEVLAQLADWDELEAITQQAQALHVQYPDPVRQAYDLGLLAEAAMAKTGWTQVKALAGQAIDTLHQAQAMDPLAVSLDWADRHHYPWYLLLLAQAEYHLGQVAEAIRDLAIARARSEPEYDPFLYLRILASLRSVYFDQGRYLDAFQLKQEQALVEFQYNLRAFAGAAHLEPKRPVLNPGLPRLDSSAIVPQEITVSGRQQDLARLMGRLNRADCKLIVIHGQSGVGKSSMLLAGLVPLLRYQGLGERDVLPLVVQVYTDWGRLLGRLLHEELQAIRGLELSVELDNTTELLNQLRQNGDRNLLTVLIFDQFEDFYTVYETPGDRHTFYDFLLTCLSIPFVKVILPIREDALHLLLELERFPDPLNRLDILNRNILDQSIRYYLGNFSPTDARAVIQSLTERSQFYLEPALVDTLVQDLTGTSGEIRPIELQIVGAQLQAEQITTLAEYQRQGPKEKLVARSLDTVIRDCGPDNEQMARLVLYLLTNDTGARPLKTRNELITDLASMGVGADLEKLDLVLQVLVGSGLVFQIASSSLDRYQLIHDYLIELIRQQRTPEMSKLVSELEFERQLRSLTQTELREALQQLGDVLEQAQQDRYQAKIAEIDALNLVVQALLPQNPQGALTTGIQAGKQLQQLELPFDRQLPTISGLTQVLFSLGIRQHIRQQWSAHAAGNPWTIAYQPQGNILASGGSEGLVHLWDAEGRPVQTLAVSNAGVLALDWSPTGQQLAVLRGDGTIQLWDITTNPTPKPQILAHQEFLQSIQFSPNHALLLVFNTSQTIRLKTLTGETVHSLEDASPDIYTIRVSPDTQWIATGSSEGKISLWSREGRQRWESQGHAGCVAGLCFSPDGQVLASGGLDGTMHFWNLAGERLQGWQGDDLGIRSLAFRSDGQALAVADDDGRITVWNLNLATLLQQGQTWLTENSKNC